MHHPTADRPIEHPFGRFQTTCAFFTRLRAAQNVHTAPLHRFMYEHRPAKPRMPGIKNFPFLGPVGVMLSSCTMRRGRIYADSVGAASLICSIPAVSLCGWV